MTPLRAVERRLLRECASLMRDARTELGFVDGLPESIAHAYVRAAWGTLERAATRAAEYRDVRDARRMLGFSMICNGCGSFGGHERDCALERVTKGAVRG